LPPSASSYGFPVAGQQPAVLSTRPVAVAQASSVQTVSTTTSGTATPASSGTFGWISPPPPSTPSTASLAPQIDIHPPSPPPVYPQTSGTSAPVRTAAPDSYYSNTPTRTPAPANVPAVPVTPIELGTGTGGEIGFQISQYHYQEYLTAGVQFMHLTGPSYGVTAQGNKTFTQGWLKDWFAGGQLRLTYGEHDYAAGNGLTANSIDDYMFDIRGLAGHDFVFQNLIWNLPDFGFSPYTGLGFRELFDDGINNSAGGFYRRYSHYLYLPVGSTERFRLTENSRLSLNTEFDWLLYGWQVSQFGDFDPGASDIDNSQHIGYGLRGSLMYEHPSWSVGPFFEYWNLGESTTNCDNVACGDEPNNQTIEFGIQGKYRF
jgi:hypothetical protein